MGNFRQDHIYYKNYLQAFENQRKKNILKLLASTFYELLISFFFKLMIFKTLQNYIKNFYLSFYRYFFNKKLNFYQVEKNKLLNKI